MDIDAVASQKRTGPAGLGRPFAVHLSVVGLSNLADGLVRAGVPLVAVGLTRSPLLMGVLTAAVWLPWLLCGIPAGVFVDRWDRRRTMAVALGLRAGLLASVAVLAAAGHLTVWWLVALAFGYGVTEVFCDLAAGAQVPRLVSREPTRLRRAHARVIAVSHLSQDFVGPPLAGAIVALGAAWTLGTPALLVVGAVLALVVGLRGSFAAPRADQQAPSRIRAELAEGWTLVWRHPVLRPLLVAGGLWNFASAAFSAVIVLWMVGPQSAGGLSEQAFGLALAAIAVGAVLGTSLAQRVVGRWGEIRVLRMAWGLNAVLGVIPLVVPTWWAFTLYLFLVGILGPLGNVITGAIRPRMVPEHVLGKVGGASTVVGYGAMPLGAVVGGQVAQLFGIPVVLAAVPVLMLLATVHVARTVPQSLVDGYEISD